MEPAQHIAFLSAQLAQTKASLRYQAACAEAAERRLRAFERTRLGGFMGSTSSCGDRCVYQTPLKSGASHLAFGSPRSLISDSASTQPYGSPSRSCVAPQHNSSSREADAVQELRQDAEDVEGLQRELELHTTISPDFLAELQRLWRNYTEATDNVISAAISTATTEGVRQALEGLRKELRQGSVYPTYELARAGSLSKSFGLPAPHPILVSSSEASTATHSPSFATYSYRRSNWPPSPASSEDGSQEEYDAGWEAQSAHVSPLFLVERKAAEAAAAVRACRSHAISEPDIDRAAPLIASSCAEYKAIRKSGQKEQHHHQQQQEGLGATLPRAPACVQSEGSSPLEDVSNAAVAESPTRSRNSAQATHHFFCSSQASPQPHAPRPGHHQLPSFSSFLSAADTAQPDRPSEPLSATCHAKACQTEYCFWPEALALVALIPSSAQSPPQADGHQTNAGPREVEHPSVNGEHMHPPCSEQRSDECAALPGQQQPLCLQPLQRHLQPAAPCKHVQQPEDPVYENHQPQQLLAVPLQRGAVPAAVPAQQQDGNSSGEEHPQPHQPQQLLAVPQRGGVVAQQQEGNSAIEGHPQPQQPPHLSSPVMRQLMDLEGCKELQIRSQLVSALLSGILHLRISGIYPSCPAGAAPLQHHLTHGQHHGHTRASTFSSPVGELLQVQGLGNSSTGMRVRVKGCAYAPAPATACAGAANNGGAEAQAATPQDVCIPTETEAHKAKDPKGVAALEAAQGAPVWSLSLSKGQHGNRGSQEKSHESERAAARHGDKGEVLRAADGCQQQDVSRLLGVVAALHHLHIPRQALGDQMQKGLSRALEIGHQAFSNQERRQRLSSFSHQPTNRRLMLYETHS